MERNNRYDKKLVMIMDRACEIFAENGYHNSSVRDVAAATRVSPAGLYYYFESKEELLYLILEACLSSLLDRIRSEAPETPDPAARLQTTIKIHLDHLQTHSKAMRVLVHEWETLSGHYGESIRTLMGEYVRLVIQCFRDLSPDRNPKELRATAFGLFGMLSWVDQWYEPGRDLPLDLLAEQFSSMALGGVAPRTSVEVHSEAVEPEHVNGDWSKPSSTSSILSGPGF